MRGGLPPVRVASPGEALAAASQPGADVEVLPRLTPQEATGARQSPGKSSETETEGATRPDRPAGSQPSGRLLCANPGARLGR